MTSLAASTETRRAGRRFDVSESGVAERPEAKAGAFQNGAPVPVAVPTLNDTTAVTTATVANAIFMIGKSSTAETQVGSGNYQAFVVLELQICRIRSKQDRRSHSLSRRSSQGIPLRPSNF